jgi:hypothetical protein
MRRHVPTAALGRTVWMHGWACCVMIRPARTRTRPRALAWATHAPQIVPSELVALQLRAILYQELRCLGKEPPKEMDELVRAMYLGFDPQ